MWQQRLPRRNVDAVMQTTSSGPQRLRRMALDSEARLQARDSVRDSSALSALQRSTLGPRVRGRDAPAALPGDSDASLPSRQIAEMLQQTNPLALVHRLCTPFTSASRDDHEQENHNLRVRRDVAAVLRFAAAQQRSLVLPVIPLVLDALTDILRADPQVVSTLDAVTVTDDQSGRRTLGFPAADRVVLVLSQLLQRSSQLSSLSLHRLRIPQASATLLSSLNQPGALTFLDVVEAFLPDAHPRSPEAAARFLAALTSCSSNLEFLRVSAPVPLLGVLQALAASSQLRCLDLSRLTPLASAVPASLQTPWAPLLREWTLSHDLATSDLLDLVLPRTTALQLLCLTGPCPNADNAVLWAKLRRLLPGCGALQSLSVDHADSLTDAALSELTPALAQLTALTCLQMLHHRVSPDAWEAFHGRALHALPLLKCLPSDGAGLRTSVRVLTQSLIQLHPSLTCRLEQLSLHAASASAEQWVAFFNQALLRMPRLQYLDLSSTSGYHATAADFQSAWPALCAAVAGTACPSLVQLTIDDRNMTTANLHVLMTALSSRTSDTFRHLHIVPYDARGSEPAPRPHPGPLVLPVCAAHAGYAIDIPAQRHTRHWRRFGPHPELDLAAVPLDPSVPSLVELAADVVLADGLTYLDGSTFAAGPTTSFPAAAAASRAYTSASSSPSRRVPFDISFAELLARMYRCVNCDRFRLGDPVDFARIAEFAHINNGNSVAITTAMCLSCFRHRWQKDASAPMSADRWLYSTCSATPLGALLGALG